jgi:Domain of unknown function (DUF1839)
MAMTRYDALSGLDPTNYQRHALHAADCVWVEKNCYADLWIEFIHALGLEPHAMLAFVLGIDFEGDQWTFFKPSHDELRELYNVDVQELTVWRPLLDHAIEHIGSGKFVSTEADAFWLPDTAGTDYRSKHTKTTIVLANIDVASRRLGYFHNAGYFELEGQDFEELFQLAGEPEPSRLPLFAELVRTDRLRKRPDVELASMARELLRKHLSRRPADNPIKRFASRFATDLPWLQQAGVAHYHLWAFGTIRQLGAAFELGALFLTWLQSHGETGLELAIEAFQSIAISCKALILKTARAVNSQRPFDASEVMSAMATAWDTGMIALDKQYRYRA